MRRLVSGLAAAAAVMVAAGASAQQQRSVDALLDSGYEVRSVAILPQDAAKRVAADASSDTVIVTLQNKSSVAVCFLALSNWLSLNEGSLTNPANCSVR
ncbi:MAG: hypothetical protein AB7O49_19545 [Sphingomonadales bacterium]